MFEFIKRALRAVWNTLKKIVLKILNFFKNIVSWFRDPRKLEKLKEDKDQIAVVIKEKLANGDYEVINVLYNKNDNTVTDAEVMSTGDIDQETRNNFKDKDMLILE